LRILVVSDREYKETSRGIDLITSILGKKNHQVDHLVFFRRKRFPEKQVTGNIRQLFFFDCLGLYRDKMRPFLPGFLLCFYFTYIIKKQKDIDFFLYDWVILESGYPVYLSLVLTNKIIYRLSDPPEIAFNSNRSFYRKLELLTVKKSQFISSAIKKFFYPDNYSDKFNYWHSGYIPALPGNKCTIKKEFVFMGGGEIDFPLIQNIANRYTDYFFHVIGSFKKRNIGNNVIFYGYLEYDNYISIIRDSSICIIPFTKRFTFQLRRCSYTAKILLPMSLGMPVLLKNYGTIQETDTEKKLFVYKNHKEALSMLDTIIIKIESGELNRDISKETRDFLLPQTVENRLKELDKTLSEWIK